MSAQEIVDLHVKSDRIIESVRMTGDYRTNNREAKKLLRLFAIVKDDLTLAEEVYSRLLLHDCVTTRVWAASDCLRLGIFVQEAVRVLEEISKRDDLGMISFDADMALRVWRGEFPGRSL
jgi:hypothetical protein